MKVVTSKRVMVIMQSKEHANMLIRQLTINDKLDGGVIKTKFGNFMKV